MDYNDEMKRIEGHEPMKEIPENFNNEEPVVPVVSDSEPVVAASSGFNGGSILAAIGAILLAGIVFFLAQSWYSGDGAKNTAYATPAKTGKVEYSQAPANASGNYVIVKKTVKKVVPSGDNTTASATANASTTVNASATANAGMTTSGTANGTAVSPVVLCLFPVNGDAIQENNALNNLAKQAVAKDADVLVTGYADVTGNPAYNQKLSQRRATAISDYLIAHGVAPSHIKTVAKGQTQAFATNALDRRVEVKLI